VTAAKIGDRLDAEFLNTFRPEFGERIGDLERRLFSEPLAVSGRETFNRRGFGRDNYPCQR
jgi:hypothetical protein